MVDKLDCKNKSQTISKLQLSLGLLEHFVTMGAAGFYN